MHKSTATATIAGTVAVTVLAAASPASASIVAPPAPITVTSTVAGDLAGTASTEAVVGTMTAAGGGGFMAGAAEFGGPIAVGGVVLIEGVSKTMAFVTGGASSGEFTCDVRLAFDPDNSCDGTVPDATYVPNSDVGPIDVPGYKPGSVWVNGSDTSAITYSATAVTYAGSDPYGGRPYPAATVTITVNWAGPNGSSQANTTIYPECVGASGQFSPGTGAGDYVMLTSTVLSGTRTVTAPAGTCATGSTFYGWAIGRAAATGTAANVQQFMDSGYYVFYVTPANPDRPPDDDPDPARWLTTTWTCASGATGTAQSRTFHESDAAWPSAPVATCADGTAVLSMTVTEQGTNVADRQLVTYTLPQSVAAIAEAEPDCIGGGCELLLERIDQVTGARLSCFSSTSLCADWWTETNQATENTDAYECSYGGTVVSLDECTVYAHAFDQGVLADPRTGETTETTPAPEPDDNGCPPPFSGWSSIFSGWWLYKGTLCAIQEAFVPTQTQTQVQDIADDLSTRAPAVQIASIGTWLSPPTNTGSTCLNWSLRVWVVQWQDIPVLDSCNPDDPIVKALTPIRTVVGIVVWLSLFAPLGWWAWREYAPGAKGVA